MKTTVTAALFAALSAACAGGIDEPLGSTADVSSHKDAPRVERAGIVLTQPRVLRRVNVGTTVQVGQDEAAFAQQVVDDLALATGFAAEAAYTAHDAALGGDRAQVEQAAIDAANAATQAQSRADEAMTVLSVQGDGCEGGDTLGDGEVTGDDVEVAVLAAANVAEATGELADAMEPTPEQTTCGCEGCTTTGGEVDEVAVQNAALNVEAAADACSAVQDELETGTVVVE